MCMCMLIKRAQILFSKDDYELLVVLANQQKSSVGELVRQAVKKTYQQMGKAVEKKELVKTLTNAWKKQKGLICYKELIEDGRNH